MNTPTLTAHKFEVLLKMAERHKSIQRLSRALISSLQIKEDAYIALKLNSDPEATVHRAVESFVYNEFCSLSTAELLKSFELLQNKLKLRLLTLFDPIT